MNANYFCYWHQLILCSGYAESPMILDAPVSGGVPAAEAGKLTFMVLFLVLVITLAVRSD